MDFDLIGGLFSVTLGCSVPDMDDLGKSTDAFEAADDADFAALQALGLDDKKFEELEDLRGSMRYEAQRSGFIQGFRLGVRLMAEAYGKA